MSTAAAVSLSVKKALKDSSVAFAILKAEPRRSVASAVSQVRAVASVRRLGCAVVPRLCQRSVPDPATKYVLRMREGVLLLEMGFGINAPASKTESNKV